MSSLRNLFRPFVIKTEVSELKKEYYANKRAKAEARRQRIMAQIRERYAAEKTEPTGPDLWDRILARLDSGNYRAIATPARSNATLGSAESRWKAAVAQEKAKGLSNAKAVAAVNKKRPGLRQQMLVEINSKSKTTGQASEQPATQPNASGQKRKHTDAEKLALWKRAQQPRGL